MPECGSGWRWFGIAVHTKLTDEYEYEYEYVYVDLGPWWREGWPAGAFDGRAE
jgi:hypothetical protein